MKAYAAAFGIELRQLLAYRLAALAGVATQIAFGVMRVQVLEACYRAGPPQAFGIAAAVDYVWLSQAFFRLIPYAPDRRLADAVRSGGVAVDLLRPLDPWGWWYARAIASFAAPTALRSAPLLALALALGWLSPPASAGALGLFGVAIVLSCLVAAAFAVLLALTAFWTIATDGIAALAPPLVWLLSGMILPLPLWPEAAQPLITLLPFRAIFDTPLRLWSGDLAGGAALAAIGHQLVWIAILVLAGRAVASRGLRRVVMQGG